MKLQKSKKKILCPAVHYLSLIWASMISPEQCFAGGGNYMGQDTLQQGVVNWENKSGKSAKRFDARTQRKGLETSGSSLFCKHELYL